MRLLFVFVFLLGLVSCGEEEKKEEKKLKNRYQKIFNESRQKNQDGMWEDVYVILDKQTGTVYKQSTNRTEILHINGKRELKIDNSISDK